MMDSGVGSKCDRRETSRLRKRNAKESRENIKKHKNFKDKVPSKQISSLMPSPIQTREPLRQLKKKQNLRTSTPVPVSTDREPSVHQMSDELDCEVHETQSMSSTVLPSGSSSPKKSPSCVKQYHSMIVYGKRNSNKITKCHKRRKSCFEEEFDEWVKQVNKEFELVEDHQLSISKIH